MVTFFFITVIIFVFLAAAGTALRHTLRYDSTESEAVQYVADKLKRIVDIDLSVEKTGFREQRKIIPVKDLEEGLSKETLIADRLALIRRMRDSHVKVNLAALQQMTLARESSLRWLAFPSFAASLSMMIGLLGTVVGLSIMVQHIGAALPADPFDVVQVEKWRREFQEVLAAMRTGFSSTLAGLLSAIVLGWLNHRLAHAQAAFLDQLDRFTTEALLPATVPDSDDDNLFEKVSLQMEGNFRRLDEVAKNNEAILRELNSVEKGFLEIVDTIRQTTRSESSDRFQGLVGKLAGVLDNMALVNQSVVNVTEAMPRLLQRIESVNTSSNSRIDRLIDSYEHQRALLQWPLQVKVVFGFLAILNLFLLGKLILR